MNRGYYVYQASGQHVGPMSAGDLAAGILHGKVQREAFAGAVGDARWQAILSIAEIADALRQLEEQAQRPAALGAPRPNIQSIPPAPPPPPDAPVTEPDVTSVFKSKEMKDAERLQKLSETARQKDAPLPQFGLESGKMAVDAPPPPPPAPGPMAGAAPTKDDKPAEKKDDKKEDKKDEPKKPAVDPKVAMFLPLGVFGAFAALAILLFLIGLIASPEPSSSTGGPTGSGAAPTHAH